MLKFAALQSCNLMAHADSTSCLSSAFHAIRGVPAIKLRRLQRQILQHASKQNSPFEAESGFLKGNHTLITH